MPSLSFLLCVVYMDWGLDTSQMISQVFFNSGGLPSASEVI